jgi:hypothetical protein
MERGDAAKLKMTPHKRIATGVKDIQMAIVSQSYLFADSVSKEVMKH